MTDQEEILEHVRALDRRLDQLQGAALILIQRARWYAQRLRNAEERLAALEKDRNNGR